VKSLRLRLTGKAVLGTVTVLATAFTLARPTAAAAQAVAPSDLVGSWAWQGETQPRLMFRADSTLRITVGTPLGDGVADGRWTLIGDTLVYTGMIARAGGEKQGVSMDRRVITLQNKVLTITRLGSKEQGPKTRMYEHVTDSIPPAPASSDSGDTP